MGDDWIPIGQGARLLGLTPRCLTGHIQKGRLNVGRDERGWRYVRRSEVWRKSLLTLGKLGELFGFSYKAMYKRRHRFSWRRYGKGGRMRVSLTDAHRVVGPTGKKEFRRLYKLRYAESKK